MSIVRVQVAASHKFCVHCRDIRISEREREKDGVELDTGNAENVYRVHIKKAPSLCQRWKCRSPRSGMGKLRPRCSPHTALMFLPVVAPCTPGLFYSYPAALCVRESEREKEREKSCANLICYMPVHCSICLMQLHIRTRML